LVASAVSHGAVGYVRLPYALLDSPQWTELPHGARSIVIGAYRRYNGSNDGNISLPYEDFSKEFSNRTFYDLRRSAVDAGFLRVTQRRKYSRAGRAPDLFALGIKP
jgi:hypothetical protein